MFAECHPILRTPTRPHPTEARRARAGFRHRVRQGQSTPTPRGEPSATRAPPYPDIPTRPAPNELLIRTVSNRSSSTVDLFISTRLSPITPEP